MSRPQQRELESVFWLVLLEECMSAKSEWSPDPAVVAELRMELGVVAMPTERIQ